MAVPHDDGGHTVRMLWERGAAASKPRRTAAGPWPGAIATDGVAEGNRNAYAYVMKRRSLWLNSCNTWHRERVCTRPEPPAFSQGGSNLVMSIHHCDSRADDA